MTEFDEPLLPLRVLTIWQPWAEMIARGWKTVENRTWNTAYRGRICIHAGTHWTNRYVAETLEALEGMELIPEPVSVDDLKRDLGKIIATADIVDCRFAPYGVEPENPWAAQGSYQFHLENIIRVPPTPCAGARGLMPIDEAVRTLMRTNIATAAVAAQLDMGI